MSRHVRQGDDPAKPPSLDQRLAHRCAAHREMQPVDDSADDGSECGVCVGEKFVKAYEEAIDADTKKKLFWPMVQSARDRLNLLAPGAGDQFEEEARQHALDYDKVT